MKTKKQTNQLTLGKITVQNLDSKLDKSTQQHIIGGTGDKEGTTDPVYFCRDNQ